MKYMPGPWTVEEYGDEDAPSLVIHSDGDTRVCFMATPGSTGSLDTVARNATLIAAAPDQYTVLRDAPILSKYHGDRGFDVERFISDYEAWSERKRAAIAKAEGRR